MSVQNSNNINAENGNSASISSEQTHPLFEEIKEALLFNLPYKGKKFLNASETQNELTRFINTIFVLLSAVTNDLIILKSYQVSDYRMLNGALLDAINVGRIRLYSSLTTSASSLNKFNINSNNIMTPSEFDNFIDELNRMAGTSLGTSPINKADIGINDLPFIFNDRGEIFHIGGETISPVSAYILECTVDDITKYLRISGHLLPDSGEIKHEMFK